MSKQYHYTTWKVPKGWNDLIEAWRMKHRGELEIRGVDSNSAAVLYILARVMEADGLMEPFEFLKLKDWGDSEKTR